MLSASFTVFRMRRSSSASKVATFMMKLKVCVNCNQECLQNVAKLQEQQIKRFR